MGIEELIIETHDQCPVGVLGGQIAHVGLGACHDWQGNDRDGQGRRFQRIQKNFRSSGLVANRETTADMARAFKLIHHRDREILK